MLNLKTLAVGTALAVASLATFAQAATLKVDRREVHQDQRIQQGVASGELNAKETYHLEKERAAINKTEAQAKADGKVTAAERKHLHHMQNRASHDIHAQKHDAQVAKR